MSEWVKRRRGLVVRIAEGPRFGPSILSTPTIERRRRAIRNLIATTDPRRATQAEAEGVAGDE